MVKKLMVYTQKISILFVLAASLILLINSDGESSQNQKIFTTVATGTQKITKRFSSKIKRDAVSMALKYSVERAVARILSPDLFTSGFRALDSRVLTNYSKYIVDYIVVAEVHNEKKYVAAVKARVNMALLKKHLKKYGIAGKKRKKPSVLVLISEKSQPDNLLKYWWSSIPMLYDSYAADAVIQSMAEDEFVMRGVDTANTQPEKYGVVFNSVYDRSAALRFGRELKADIVIIGRAESFEAMNRMGEEKIYEADITLDIFNVSTKRKIKTIGIKTTVKGMDAEEGNISALKKAGLLAAQEITAVTDRYWAENVLKKVQRIETIIKGENYLSNFIMLRKALNDISDVKSVKTKELGADQAIVSILFKGNAEQLAQALLLKTFESFGIEIYNVKERSFTIKFVSR